MNDVEWLLAIGAVAALAWVAVLLAGSCFGFPFFNLPMGPLPLTADRVLLGVLMAQYVVYRQWGRTDPKPLATADYLLIALLVVLVGSTFTHDFRYRNAMPLSQLVFYFLMPAILYWIVRQARWSQQAAWWVLASLAGFGVYLCLTAVAESQGAWEFVFPKYIASPAYVEFFGRGRGPYLNPVADGIVAGLGLCAALVWWPRLNRPARLAGLGVLAIFAVGIYCTYTRSVWIGAGLGLLIIVALATPREWRVAVVGSAVVVSSLTMALGWEHFLSFKRDQYVSAEDVADSAKLRPILAMVAWHMFLDRPIFGCGFGQYVQEAPAYLSDRSSDLPLEKARPYIQHNAFFALLTETGIVGMGLFVGLLGCWTRAAWRLWRSEHAPPWVRDVGLMFLGFMGVYLTNAMFHDVSIIPMVNMVLFFLGGSVMALVPASQSKVVAKRLKVWVPEGELAGVS
jgi:hypothetical protein